MSFARRIAALEEHVRAPGAAGPRNDLPATVADLASRLGAAADQPPRAIRLRQEGAMRQRPGAAEMRFRAEQTIGTARTAFVWHAAFAPLGVMRVADYYVDGTGGLEARLLGLVPVVRLVGGELVAKGEIMRYLAELPWAPDAIGWNPALRWQQLDERTLAVSVNIAAGRATVRLLLDHDGLIVAAEADDRPRLEGATTVARPWRGRFWDHRRIAGRLIPTAAEASWILDSVPFVYWRGKLTGWSAWP